MYGWTGASGLIDKKINFDEPHSPLLEPKQINQFPGCIICAGARAGPVALGVHIPYLPRVPTYVPIQRSSHHIVLLPAPHSYLDRRSHRPGKKFKKTATQSCHVDCDTNQQTIGLGYRVGCSEPMRTDELTTLLGLLWLGILGMSVVGRVFPHQCHIMIPLPYSNSHSTTPFVHPPHLNMLFRRRACSYLILALLCVEINVFYLTPQYRISNFDTTRSSLVQLNYQKSSRRALPSLERYGCTYSTGYEYEQEGSGT